MGGGAAGARSPTLNGLSTMNPFGTLVAPPLPAFFLGYLYGGRQMVAKVQAKLCFSVHTRDTRDMCMGKHGARVEATGVVC